MRMTKKDVLENRRRLLERDAFHKRHGYDSASAVAFVLSRTLPLPGRILELGTGKGRFLAAILEKVPRVTTIDVDPAEQHVARMNAAFEGLARKARFVCADAAHLPFARGRFDAVVSMNALHHLKHWKAVLEEALRVLKPSGKLVLADFNRKGFRVFDRIHRAEGRTHQRFPYRFAEVLRFLREKGCRVRTASRGCQWVAVAQPFDT
jgi:ubiquinone/menaquinone biosynthesis C-methylase UbiE